MRLLLVILAAALIIGAAYHAFASPDPKIEQPTTRLQKPKSKTHCILKMTTSRFYISPKGEMEYAGGFTIWTACDR